MHKGMGITKSIIEHPEWGTIIVARNARARRIILRSRPDGIHLTVPAHATKGDIERAIADCVPKLLKKSPKATAPLIDREYTIVTDNFTFSVEEHTANVFQIRYNGKEAVLLCPVGTAYGDEKMQQWLRGAVTTALTRRAKQLLPPRLKALAGEKGFAYGRCTVRNVHGRWGSCNTKKNISLSIYLALLPNELIDYVLLHELCHTVEMNHSEKFWLLLDKVTAPAKAKELRKKLKTYRTNF